MKPETLGRGLRRIVVALGATFAGTGAAWAGSIQQPGLTTGLAEGYGLTEGWYSVSAYNLGTRRTKPTGTTSATFIPAFITWATPWEPMGARLLFKAAPFVHVDLNAPGLNAASLYNPYYGAWLSWYLGNGLNLAIGEGVQVGLNSPVARAMGRDFNAFQQNVALSYVKDNWNITGNAFFTEGRTSPVMSQPRTANLDFTAIKRDGRMESGVIAYGQWDLNRPSVGYGAKQSEVAVGGMISYLIGNQVSLQLKLTTTLQQRNLGGRDTRLWLQFVVPLHTPPGPEPRNAPP